MLGFPVVVVVPAVSVVYDVLAVVSFLLLSPCFFGFLLLLVSLLLLVPCRVGVPPAGFSDLRLKVIHNCFETKFVPVSIPRNRIQNFFLFFALTDAQISSYTSH